MAAQGTGQGSARDIRAAFFDIDGTLTSFETHEVPSSTVEALHALRERGVKIFICTGRAPSHMGVVLDMIPVRFDGIVGLTGQYCFDDQGFIATRSLDPDDVATIIAWLDEHPEVSCNFCEGDSVYFNQVTDALRHTWSQLGKTAPRVEIGDPHVRAPGSTIYQISPFVDERLEAEVVARCRNVAGVRWHPDFVDLIPADGGKPAGMSRFLDRYGLSADQAIAFGDGGNDVTMLAYAGIGVAMGNAAPDAKAAADYVTDDVDHHGIANALRHFGVI